MLVGSDVIYVSKDGRYMVQGRMIDLVSKEDLTETSPRLAEARKKEAKERVAAVNKLGEDKMIIFSPPGKADHTITAVSYTHLDVYKRQPLGCGFPNWSISSRGKSVSIRAWCGCWGREARNAWCPWARRPSPGWRILPVVRARICWAAGSGNDRFRSPSGLAIDSTGRLFVSDSANDRVQVFSLTSGSPVYVATIGETGVPGNDAAHFDFPAQIALDSNNRLYVADVNNSRVQRCVFTTAWACTTFHGTGSPGSGPSQLNQAFGLGSVSYTHLP